MPYRIGIKHSLVGQRFGRLVVAGHAGTVTSPKGKRCSLWICVCDCGSPATVTRQRLRDGLTKSCGCLRSELVAAKNKTHGMSDSRAYNVWRGMMNRCDNKASDAYKNYGDRGITVCDQWKTFEGFYKDMGNPPPGLTIERVNNDLGYSKSNCKWGTRTEQSRNRRGRKMIEFNGATHCLSEWAELAGVTSSFLSKQIKLRPAENVLADAFSRGGV